MNPEWNGVSIVFIYYYFGYRDYWERRYHQVLKWNILMFKIRYVEFD